MAIFLAIAASLGAAAAADPTAVLTAARAQVLENIRRMPNYTCVQTIDRRYYTPAGKAPANCSEQAVELRHTHSDRLRLEVAVSTDRELYSWVGAREFGDGEISDVVRFGPIGTGSFAAYLGNIFGGRVTRMKVVGTSRENDRELMTFAYSIPKEQSRYRVRGASGWVVTAFEGQVTVDTATGTLVTLSIRTIDLPPTTNTCESRSTLSYATVKIGEGGFLLPREVRQRFVARNGVESENVTVFSACREYRGESVVRFDADPDQVAAEASKKQAAALQLRPGLVASVEWTTPIDSASAAAGDPLQGKLASPLRDRQAKIAVPAGAAIEGRIMRVQMQHGGSPAVTIVRRVETIEIGGVRVPFPARVYSNQDLMERARGLSRTRAAMIERYRLPGEEDYEVIHVPSARARLRAGSKSDWVTVKAAR